MPVAKSRLSLGVIGYVMGALLSCSAPERGQQCPRCHTYGIRLTVIETNGNVRRIMDITAKHKNVARLYQNDFGRGLYEPVLAVEIIFEEMEGAEADLLQRQLAACPGVTEAVLWCEK